jgi:alanine dehydrogenase
VQRALDSDPGFMRGLNVAAGDVTYEPVAREQGRAYVAPQDVLSGVAVAA